MKKIFTLLIAFSFCFLGSAQQPEILNLESEKAAVINQVEQFLIAVGNYEKI
jgi:hypothetical protein